MNTITDMNGNPTISNTNFASYTNVNPTLNEDKIVKFLQAGLNMEGLYKGANGLSILLFEKDIKEILNVCSLPVLAARTNETPGLSYLYHSKHILMITLEHCEGTRSNYKTIGSASFCVEGSLIKREDKIFLELTPNA